MENKILEFKKALEKKIKAGEEAKMQKIDYKQQVELLVEELNILARDPFRMKKGLFGEFKCVTEIYSYDRPGDMENEIVDSIFYYIDTRVKSTPIFSIRKKYRIPYEITKYSRINSDEAVNIHFKELWREILKWMLLGKTTGELKTPKGDSIQYYGFKDIIEGNYELPDNY